MANLERSCGAIVFTLRDNEPLFVIVQEQAGAYSFPKGHMEGSETEIETARREVFEEIGIRPVFLDGFCEADEYDLAEKPGTRKRVTYFLAEFGSEPLLLREGEIRGIQLLCFDEALKCFEYEGTRKVLTAAYRFVKRSNG